MLIGARLARAINSSKPHATQKCSLAGARIGAAFKGIDHAMGLR
jgi:hypothetical protein